MSWLKSAIAIVAALLAGINAPADVTATPTRGTQVQVTDTLPPPPTTVPVPTGLHSLPFAPADLRGCAEMEFYRKQAGLPSDFDWIGRAESTCVNTASTFCCHGYFQVHTLWINGRSGRECDVYSKWDYDDTTALSKQKAACMAVIVLDESGVCAWDVVRC